MTATELQFAETTKIELSEVSNISVKLINSSTRSINMEALIRLAYRSNDSFFED